MNTYITWSMTLFALYIARKRRNKEGSEGEIRKEIHEFHMQSRSQSFDEGELRNYIDTLYNFMRERFNLDFQSRSMEWVVKDYDNIKYIVIGHDGSEEITIDNLLQMIDTYYINPEQITNPTPEHFKNLDLGGRSQIKVFLKKTLVNLIKETNLFTF